MSRFARNVMVLGSGNVAAQAISILAVPVLTRIYDPNQFGAYSFVFSVVAVAFPISTLRLNSAILLPKEEGIADRLLLLSIVSVLVVTLTIMPALALGLDFAMALDEATRAVLWFLVAGVLVHGLVSCLEFWLLRHREFGALAWGTVGESLADRAFAIAMGLSQSASAAWLALGRVVGGAVHLAVFVTRIARSGRRPAPGGSGPLLDVVRRYRDFPMYSTWALLFANGGRELPTLVLGGMFSAAVAGMYALGVRVLGFPTLLIGDAVAKVFFRYATGIADEPGRLEESTRLMVRAIVYAMFPPMLLLCVAGPALFGLVFGPEWAEAGRYAQVLAMSFFVTFLYRVLGIFFDICDKQGMRLVFDAAQFLGRIGAMLAGGLLWGVDGALWGLLLATLLVHGAAVVYLLLLTGVTAAGTAGLLAASLVNLLPITAGLLAAGAFAHAPVAPWLLLAAGLALQVPWLLRREPVLAAYGRRLLS